jgi:predicted nucleic acid-binding OB-fold protein
MQDEIFALSDALLSAREAKRHAEAALKEVTAAVGDLERQLIELMLTDELDGFKRNGVQFTLVNTKHISAEPTAKDELWTAMKEQGYDHLFSVNAQTLSGEVKRLMEENEGLMPEWLNGLVTEYDKPSIRIKK